MTTRTRRRRAAVAAPPPAPVPEELRRLEVRLSGREGEALERQATDNFRSAASEARVIVVSGLACLPEPVDADREG